MTTESSSWCKVENNFLQRQRRHEDFTKFFTPVKKKRKKNKSDMQLRKKKSKYFAIGVTNFPGDQSQKRKLNGILELIKKNCCG